MVSSNRCRDLISSQQYSPESKCIECLLEEQKWGCGYNQSLPGLCCALIDLYPGINSIFPVILLILEHCGLKAIGHFLSIPLFITLVRGQKSVCFTNIRICSCLWAFIREQRNIIKVNDTENRVVNSNIYSGLGIFGFCRKMTPASQSHGKTQLSGKSWVYISELGCSKSDEQKWWFGAHTLNWVNLGSRFTSTNS